MRYSWHFYSQYLSQSQRTLLWTVILDGEKYLLHSLKPVNCLIALTKFINVRRKLTFGGKPCFCRHRLFISAVSRQAGNILGLSTVIFLHALDKGKGVHGKYSDAERNLGTNASHRILL